MKIAIMQPYFFPYIGYFQLINAVDKFVIYDDVNYINRGWINRNRILVNGTPNFFTIPLKKASQNKLINEIDVSMDKKERKNFLRTFELSYKNSPYFNIVYPLIVNVMISQELKIAELAILSIQAICKYLEINTEFIVSSKKYSNSDLKTADRLIDICRIENYKHYINPIGGIKLYDKKEFEKNDIKLNFLKTLDFSYNQFDNNFIPNLSIIDVMMFNSKKEIKKMLNEYSLI